MRVSCLGNGLSLTSLRRLGRNWMTGGLALRLAMFASLALPPIPLAAQEDSQQWQVSRTEWGDPDFRGMWPLEVGQTPMQRNPRYGEQAWLTDEEYAAAL